MDGESRSIVIENVQCIPNLCANLLSVAKIVLKDLEVVFNKSGCTIYDKEKNVVACRSLVNNMFKLDTVVAESVYKVD